MDNAVVYKAATNPVLAVRIAGGPGYPQPGYPEVLVFKQATPALDIWTLQEAVYTAIKTLDDRYGAIILARFGEQTTLQKYGDRIGRSRERVRQLEAKALRMLRLQLRDNMTALRGATEVVPIPGSALDPDWISTAEATGITGYTRAHVRHLCRTKRVVSQVNPLRQNHLQISKLSLRRYVLSERPGDRRMTGEWREDDEQV